MDDSMDPDKSPDLALDNLLVALRQLHAEQARKVLTEWQRSLPFGDYIVDRWERAASLGFGPGASIYDSALVLGQVRIGEKTWIGPFTVLDGSGGLDIGAFCSISAGVQIYSHDTVAWALSGGTAPAERAPVSIGSRCYLGPNVVVSKGVRIGDGCVIGANSLVNSDIPAGSRAWGTPARVIGLA
ncbi:acyltransferase [Hydrogenophaga sp. 2FB]|uniref:acyltransferase n=1 Tax=Hydrogenophaga sp. 2FB TaxID=2502187 RepID=UPI00207B98EE|nr:acyltransferase [Hydrogenophaga sp. 2FB]